MSPEEFISYIEQQHQRRLRILNKPEKARMGGSSDRLSQFRRLAKLQKVSPQSVAMNLCSKQFSDLIDMADGTHQKSGDIKLLRELVSDVQNYLDVVLALGEEGQNA